MRRPAFAFVSLAILSACAPAVPDSGSGVGFQSYADYQAQREAQLIANGEGGAASNGVTSTLNAQAISSEAPASGTSALADEALAAIGQGTTQGTSANAPSDPTGQYTDAASLPRPYAVENAAGISAENDFDAVSSERSIAQDAARAQAIRDSYQVIQPTAVLARPSGSTTSLVEFALSTTNSVGQPLYSRLVAGAESRAARNCAKYPSPDLAQEAFLQGGGPTRNVQGMDPDGDGFACSWDPSPFRNAAR